MADCARCGHDSCYHEGSEQMVGDWHLKGWCRGLFIRSRVKQPYNTHHGCSCPGFVAAAQHKEASGGA